MKVKIEFGKNRPYVFHKEGIHGFIEITQVSADKPTHFLVAVGGLKPGHLHGFHIHENPVKDYRDLQKTCDSCGGHFNPTNKNHGSIFNKDGGKDRHVGDLINNLKADEKGQCVVHFTDDLACLIKSADKNYSIIGKSIVIHSGTDDLGRCGLDKNLPYLESNMYKNVIVNKENKNINPKQKYNIKTTEGQLKFKNSKINGNAGSRIACANISN